MLAEVVVNDTTSFLLGLLIVGLILLVVIAIIKRV